MQNNILAPTAISFHTVTIRDCDRYNELTKNIYLENCDCVFGNVLFWADSYHTQIAFFANCVLMRYEVNDRIWFSFPVGERESDRQLCIQTLLEHCRNVEQQPLRFSIITENQRQFLLKYFPLSFEIDSLRQRYDYVYEVSRLAALKGPKLAKKRNHIHRFEEKGDWYYCPVTSENISECYQMEEDWLLAQDLTKKELSELEYEKKALFSALDHFQELHLMGGMIYLNEKLVAFCIGERLNHDTMVIHFEKAFGDIQGAYQVINQQFLIHHQAEFRYVNREDDTGDPGLRRSKLSYYPDFLVKKYDARESNVVYAVTGNAKEIISLWQEAFGDEEEYINFYLENRFTDDTMLVREKDQQIRSMASFLNASVWIPAPAASEGELCALEIPVKYVYAVATSKEAKSQGYATSIIKHASEKYHMPLILQPGSDSLFQFYAKMGFTDPFRKIDAVYEISADFTAVKPCRVISEITEEVCKSYYTVRESLLKTIPHVVWDNHAISYALQENAFCQGSLAQFEDGYILYRPVQHSDDEILIVEMLLPEGSEATCVSTLLSQTGKKKALHKNAGGMILYGDCDLFHTSDIYLGLTLC